jgi:hypothetical protein
MEKNNFLTDCRENVAFGELTGRCPLHTVSNDDGNKMKKRNRKKSDLL